MHYIVLFIICIIFNLYIWFRKTHLWQSESSCSKYLTENFPFQKYYFETKRFLLQVEDDFRGCSPFILQGATDEEDQICNVAQLDGLSHRNCKHSCTDDNCNKNILTRGHSCYTCTGTRDAAGNPVGNSDDRCFFSLNERLIINII